MHERVNAFKKSEGNRRLQLSEADPTFHPQTPIADTGEEIILLITNSHVMILYNKIKIKWLPIYIQNNVKIFLVSCGASSINIVTRFTLYKSINKAEATLNRLVIQSKCRSLKKTLLTMTYQKCRKFTVYENSHWKGNYLSRS